MKTYPCKMKKCPPGCPDPVVFVEGVRPPFTIVMHESEYLAWKGSQPAE